MDCWNNVGVKHFEAPFLVALYLLGVDLEDIADKQGTLTTETTFRTSWTLPELEHGTDETGIATNRFW